MTKHDKTILTFFNAKAGDEYGSPIERHGRDEPVNGKSYEFNTEDGEWVLVKGENDLVDEEKTWLGHFMKQDSPPRQRLLHTLGGRTFTLGIPTAISGAEDLYFGDGSGVIVTLEANEERWHRPTWRFLYKYKQRNEASASPPESIITGRLWVDSLTGDPLLMIERNAIRCTLTDKERKHFQVDGIRQSYREWQYLDKENVARKLVVDVHPQTAPEGEILALEATSDGEHLMILSRISDANPTLTVWNLRYGGLESEHHNVGDLMRLGQFDNYVFTVDSHGLGSGLVKIGRLWNRFGSFTKVPFDWSVRDLCMLNSYACLALASGKVVVVNPGYDDVLCYESFSEAPLVRVAATNVGAQVWIAAVDEARHFILRQGRLTGRRDACFSEGARIKISPQPATPPILPFTGEVKAMEWIQGKQLLLVSDEAGLVHVYDAEQRSWTKPQSVGLIFDVDSRGWLLTSRGTWEFTPVVGGAHWTPMVKRNLPATTRVAQAVFDQNVVFYVSEDDVHGSAIVQMMDLVTGNELQRIQANTKTIISAVASPGGEVTYTNVDGTTTVLDLTSLETRSLGPERITSTDSSSVWSSVRESASGLSTRATRGTTLNMGLKGAEIVRVIQASDGSHLAVLKDGTVLQSLFDSDQWKTRSNVLPKPEFSTRTGEQRGVILESTEAGETERIFKFATYFFNHQEYFFGDTVVDVLSQIKDDQGLLVLTAMGNLIEHDTNMWRNRRVEWVSSPFSKISSPVLVPCADGDRFAVVGTQNRPGWYPNIPVTQIRRREDLSLTMELFPDWGETTAHLFIPSRNLFVSGYKSGNLRIWSLNSGAAVLTKEAHKAGILAISTIQDERKLITVAEDGSIKLWEIDWMVDAGRRHTSSVVLDVLGLRAYDRSFGMANIDLVATIVPFSDGNVAAVTPDGYVSCPGNGLRQLYFSSSDGHSRDFEEFGQVLQRPDIVYERMGIIAQDRVEAARHVVKSVAAPPDFRKGLRELKLSVAPVPFRASEGQLLLEVSVTPVKNEVYVKVSVNSVPVAPLALKVDEGETAQGTVQLALSRGVNRIHVYAEGEGSWSRRESLQVFWDASPSKRNIYAVVAGVSHYQHREIELTYPAKDAHDLGEALRALSDCSRSVSVLEIPEAKVTVQNLRKASAFLRQANTEDVAVLFLAGHGFVSPAGEYLFATVDTDPADPVARALSGNEIRAILQATPARQRLLLIDTCHSAGIGQSGRAVLGGKQKASMPVDIGRSRGGLEETPMGPTSPVVNTLVELTRSYETRDGIVTLAASAASGSSFEPKPPLQLKNGLFTHALLQAISSNIADRNGDGTITVSEINAYISSSVLHYTGGVQVPTMATVNLDNDFWW